MVPAPPSMYRPKPGNQRHACDHHQDRERKAKPLIVRESVPSRPVDQHVALMADWREEVRRGANRDRHQEGIRIVAKIACKCRCTGAATSTVAALFRKGVTAIATTMMRPSDSVGGRAAAPLDNQTDARSVTPVVLRLSDRGMRQASVTSTGGSSAS